MDEPTASGKGRKLRRSRRVMRPDAKKARARARRCVAAVAADAPNPSVWARRLLVLTRFAGREPGRRMTLVEVDRLTEMVPGQAHAFVRRTRNPHVGTLLKYAALFGVHPAWFVTGYGPRPHLKALREAVAAARERRALEEAKAAVVSEAALDLAQRLRGMTREEFEAARRDARAFTSAPGGSRVG